MADFDVDLTVLRALCRRLSHDLVAPNGHPAQHAFDDEGVEQVGRAENLPGVELDLGACGGPALWALGAHPPPAQHNRSLGGAVPAAGALWGSDPGVLSLKSSVNSAASF